MHLYRPDFVSRASTRGKAGLWVPTKRATAPHMNPSTLANTSTLESASTLTEFGLPKMDTSLGAVKDRRPRVLVIGATPAAFLSWSAIHKEGDCRVVAVVGIPSASFGAPPRTDLKAGEEGEKALLENTTDFITACIKAFDLPSDTTTINATRPVRGNENHELTKTATYPKSLDSPTTAPATVMRAQDEGDTSTPKEKLRGIKVITNIQHIFKAPIETPLESSLSVSPRIGVETGGILDDVDIVYVAVDSLAVLPPLSDISAKAGVTVALGSFPQPTSGDSRLPLILHCIERGKHVILDHPLASSEDYVKAANAALGGDHMAADKASPRILLLDSTTTQPFRGEHGVESVGLPALNPPSPSFSQSCKTPSCASFGSSAVLRAASVEGNDIGEVRHVRLHLCLPLRSEHVAKGDGAKPRQNPFQGATDDPATAASMRIKIITRILDYGGPLGVLGLAPPSTYEVAMRALLTRAMVFLLRVARWQAPSGVIATAGSERGAPHVVEGALFFSCEEPRGGVPGTQEAGLPTSAGVDPLAPGGLDGASGGHVTMRFYLSVEPTTSFLQVCKVHGTRGGVERRDVLMPTVASTGTGSPPSPAAVGGGDGGVGAFWRTLRSLLQEAPTHPFSTPQRPTFSIRGRGGFGMTNSRFRRDSLNSAQGRVRDIKVSTVDKSMRLVINKDHAGMVLMNMRQTCLVHRVVEAVELSISMSNISGMPK
ncbi:unnamed protein product [Phytomonas sp. EM1]|nr:unnamed protein product [Phytomonas sp. EM1]|eukprot:CCW63763.1 unnamed protein product [Phytomonas sp. isolate EM1]